MRLLACVALMLAGMTSAQAVSAQGLAAAAEREKERRAKQKAAAGTKAYGDNDLGKTGAPLANDPSVRPAVENLPPEAAPAPTSSPAAGVAKGKGEGGTANAKNEAYWRDRARAMRSDLAVTEAQLKEAERAAAGGTPRTPDNTCKPSGSYKISGAPICDEINRDRRREAQDRLGELRQSVAAFRQELRAFEVEAHKAGVPPEWIR